MSIIRVFPRQTTATPTDENVRIGGPTMFDGYYSEVRISVTFTWDKTVAEDLAEQWRTYARTVTVGGPAYNDKGGDFVPGMYLKKGYVITSRGCPNRCGFCYAWKREGGIRELPITEGYNILDNNILACSDKHLFNVFEMLKRQPQRARLTGGLEAKILTQRHVDMLVGLKPEVAFFAYDTPDDYEPLVVASKMLHGVGLLPSHSYRCYVLCAYDGDTMSAAEKRLQDTMSLGFMPMAMVFNKEPGWESFQREWANPWIVGSKMQKIGK